MRKELPVATHVANGRSRRAVLTAAAAAAAATVASVVARPLAVLADDDGSTIQIGHTYSDVRSTTTLTNVTNNEPILWADMEPLQNNPLTDGGTAIRGISSATHGVGVSGYASDNLGYGVEGSAAAGVGVYGYSD